MTRESASVGPTNDSVAGAYQRDDPAPVTRLAALLHEQEFAGNDGTWANASERDRTRFLAFAARLIEKGVRVPTEAGASVGDDGLTDGLREWWDSLSDDERWDAYRIEKSDAAALAAKPAPTPWRDFSRAYLTEHGSDPEAASPAPTLDRERLARALTHVNVNTPTPPVVWDDGRAFASEEAYAAAIADAYEAEP